MTWEKTGSLFLQQRGAVADFWDREDFAYQIQTLGYRSRRDMEDSQGTAANPSKVVKVTSTRSKRGREKLTGLFNDSAHSITVHRSGTLDFY